jgi:hypothetical protein
MPFPPVLPRAVPGSRGERVEGFPYPLPVAADVHDGRILLFPHHVSAPDGRELVLYHLIYTRRYPEDRALKHLKPGEQKLVIADGRDEVRLAGLRQKPGREQGGKLVRLVQQLLDLFAKAHAASKHDGDAEVQPAKEAS